MFSRIVSFILLPLALILSGCATKTKVEQVIVYKTRTIVIAPSAHLLTTVNYVPPPNKDLYLMSKPRDREKMLVDTYLEQNKTIDACNRNIEAIKDWVQKQSSEHEDTE